MTLKSTSSTPALPTRHAERGRLHLLALPALLGLGTLAACGDKKDEGAQPAAKAAAVTPDQAYEKIAAQGKGFTVGALMAANPAYVLFDPQCPHCGHLWTASQALLPKAKFVWIPVSFINGKSAPQGAAILSAANPAEFMAAHETSLLAGTGGTPLPASVAPEVEATIKANTVLFNDLSVESVPYVVAKNVKTGQVVTHAGAMETAALAELLGLS
ncbi:DsbC family protein [Rhodoferax sp.]|uniref:DsbC family protein n=1 Tax=Rhodoferax sp. TaxID=50421 RepID=UPI0025DA28AD|nr:DsbC family protein [Rhodoferax sp.]